MKFLDFILLVGPQKQSEDVTLGFWESVLSVFKSFGTFYISNNDSDNHENNQQIH